MNMFYN